MIQKNQQNKPRNIKVWIKTTGEPVHEMGKGWSQGDRSVQTTGETLHSAEGGEGWGKMTEKWKVIVKD